MKQWYAVHTRSGWEKKVVRLLYKKKVENYFPLSKTVSQFGERRKIIEEPLFKSYVFVHIEEKERLVIRQTEGIINFVYRVNQPVIIGIEEITAMQDFLGTHKNVMLERISFKVLEKTANSISALSDGYTAGVTPGTEKAMLRSLGYVMVAEPDAEGVNITAPSLMPYLKKPFYQYGAAVR